VRGACRAAGISLEQPVGLISPDHWLILHKVLRA
jgi:23S rRNA (adenine-N6)-dimethyltransferase